MDTTGKMQETLEIKEVISSAEARFEYWRKTIGLFAGPSLFVILYFIPMPGLSYQAHSLAAVLGWVLVYWISEAIPIPVTALLGMALSIIFGVASGKEVLAPFADPIIFLFIGSFLIAEAMRSINSIKELL